MITCPNPWVHVPTRPANLGVVFRFFRNSDNSIGRISFSVRLTDANFIFRWKLWSRNAVVVYVRVNSPYPSLVRERKIENSRDEYVARMSVVVLIRMSRGRLILGAPDLAVHVFEMGNGSRRNYRGVIITSYGRHAAFVTYIPAIFRFSVRISGEEYTPPPKIFRKK